MDFVIDKVTSEAGRIASQGSWPAWIAPESLLERVPDLGQMATGFDAGIACALDLIPRDRQKLASILHAAYTPEAVDQVRQEIETLDADSETTWWLAACSVCVEKPINAADFLTQIANFTDLILDPATRRDSAYSCLLDMKDAFQTKDGHAFALRDGGMQGAYIAGHEFAGMYNTDLDLYFLGTFHPSLGLENFAWKHPAQPDSDDADKRMGRSGPVHGSRQFVKCADREEYEAALSKVQL